MDIDVIYSSSLKRTLQTAQYIADAKNLPIIRTDKLKEINGGEWEGKRWDELPGCGRKLTIAGKTDPTTIKCPVGRLWRNFKKID